MVDADLSSVLRPLDAVVSWLCRVSLWAGAGATLGILTLLVGSSMLRYVLGTPLAMTEELAGLLFVATAFCAVPYAMLAGRQIRLLVLVRHLPAPLVAWASVVGDLLGAFLLLVIVVQQVRFAEYSRAVGARTDVGEILLWPWMLLMPAMLALLALALTLRCVQRATLALRGQFVSPAAAGPEH